MSPVWINIFGYAAAICMVCGYLPQAIYTIRTRDTDGIAMPTFLLMGLGGCVLHSAGCVAAQLAAGDNQCHHHYLCGNRIRDKDI